MVETRNEWEAVCNKYQEVLEWESQFAAEIESSKQEEVSSYIVTMYHGTWNKDIQFGEREVKNYNSIGTWTTESVEHAKMYGSYVVETKATVNNAYQVTEDFFQFFGGDDMMMNGQHVKKLKEKLVEQGYDAIMFKDSNIDLGSNEGTHTVVVLLNPIEQIVEYKYVG